MLLTSSRPSALARLGLAWADLEARYPRLVQVAIVGQAAPDQERPGHDLTYLAPFGLVSPPVLPQTLVADLGGAERAVTAAVALLLARERGDGERYAEVALADAAEGFSLPWTFGLTVPGGVLGGGYPFYGLYEAKGGWIAVAALEPRFRDRLVRELGVDEPSHEAFRAAFAARTPAEWEAVGRRARPPDRGRRSNNSRRMSVARQRLAPGEETMFPPGPPSSRGRSGQGNLPVPLGPFHTLMGRMAMSDFAGFSVDPELVLRRGQIEADSETFGASPEPPPDGRPGGVQGRDARARRRRGHGHGAAARRDLRPHSQRVLLDLGRRRRRC